MGKAKSERVFKSLRWSTPGHVSDLDGRTPLPHNWCNVLDLRFVFQAAWSSGLDDGKANKPKGAAQARLVRQHLSQWHIFFSHHQSKRPCMEQLGFRGCGA